MWSELERRLEAMLADAPDPEPGAGEEALHRALRTLHPVAASRRGLRTGLLAFAAALVLLVIAAGSLAAAGALHVSLGAKPAPKPPATTQLTLPQGANGIAAIVNGRLSVVTRSGFRLQGLPATAAALSPNALYVAAGIGDSLVALKPDASKAWSHPAGGKVVAIAWAPDGIRIAYVVRTKGRYPDVLHVIWGNGTHDTVVDRRVDVLTPSWRADSLALAYAGAGGRPIVYDLEHLTHRAIGVPGGPALRLAFAPTGSVLAVNTLHRTVLVGAGRTTVWRGKTHGIGWLDGRLATAGGIPGLPQPILAFAAHGKLLAVAVGDRRTIRVLAGEPGHLRTVFQVQARSRCFGERPAEVCAAPIGDGDLKLG
ncbi:MAG TPA: hypothetical protein VE984_06170 [Gaiellaceae bacterium]|nr:hypothetical protein [Gaiellaceae bacterium]